MSDLRCKEGDLAVIVGDATHGTNCQNCRRLKGLFVSVHEQLGSFLVSHDAEVGITDKAWRVTTTEPIKEVAA